MAIILTFEPSFVAAKSLNPLPAQQWKNETWVMSSLVLQLPLYSVFGAHVCTSIRRNLYVLLWRGCSVSFLIPSLQLWSNMKSPFQSLSWFFPFKCSSLCSHHLATSCKSPVAFIPAFHTLAIAKHSHEHWGLSLFNGLRTFSAWLLLSCLTESQVLRKNTVLVSHFSFELELLGLKQPAF